MNDTTEGSSNKLLSVLLKEVVSFLLVLGLPSLLIKQHTELFAQMCRILWIK